MTLLEATGALGGTTAVSGGAIWVPSNPWAAAAGIQDDRSDAIAYLRCLELGDVDRDRSDAYVRLSAPTVRRIEQATALRWEMQPGWPDYHAEYPGSTLEGRSLEIGPVSVDKAALARVRVDPYGVPPMTVNEERSASPPDRAELARREREGIVTRGRGLVAACHDALRALGAEIRIGVRVEELVGSSDAVRGAVVDGETLDGAVVIATGGFERSSALVRRFLRGPMTAPGGAPASLGDGLRMGMRLGAAIGNMSEAWWCPALAVPGEQIDDVPFNRMLFLDCAAPGGVLADQHGRRFVNEAANYNELGRALQELDASTFRYTRSPCWYVFDSARRERQFGPLAAADPDPRWLHCSPSLAGLADAIGVPAEALEDSVGRFNFQVAAGGDSDFGRGGFTFDRFSAGTAQLRGLTEPPYYAVQVQSGCLGTKGGLITDDHGRVLALDGDPIEGLYAAGNAAASPFGSAYPGGGSTIGPALVYGWLAGEAAAA